MSSKRQCGCGEMMDSGAARCLACYRRGGARVPATVNVQLPVGPPITPPSTPPPAAIVAADRTVQRQRAELAANKLAYAEALHTIERLEQEQLALGALHGQTAPLVIEPRHGSGTSEGTIVAVASDWHIEERVGAEVGGLNLFSLEIAQARGVRFFQSLLRLTKLLQQDIRVETVVLALLGDFISNDIHDEIAEMAEVLPMDAIVVAQNMIIGGIDFLLTHTTCRLVIPCHSGNHARTTKQTHFSAENGHSLEYLMYLHLQAYYRSEPRVQFDIAKGYHSYLPIYETRMRFHHGHGVKYNGGVGGLTIPVNKAIAQWNKARPADLDVFGHFHQRFDGGNFVANGSLIGYNGFAVAIKASYEKPAQQLFLMDKRRGRTCVWPILVE